MELRSATSIFSRAGSTPHFSRVPELCRAWRGCDGVHLREYQGRI